MRRVWPWLFYGLALCLLLGAHAVALLHWIELDQMVAGMVCCDMALTVSEFLRAEAEGRLSRLLLEPTPGWMALPVLAGRPLLGAAPDVLLWVTLVQLVATQLLLFLLGRRLAGPAAGVIAAGLFPLLPEVALMSRKWAPMVPHFLLLVAGAALVIRSRSFTRVLPSAGYILVVLTGSLVSMISTDNMLFVAAAGSIAAGATARGLLLGRGPLEGERVTRWKVLIGAGLVAGLTLYALRFTLEPYVRLSYYRQEMALPTYEAHFPRWHWRALTAYVANMAYSSIGMIAGMPFLAGLVLYLRRGPARAELMAWLWLPLIALSLIGKKNPYYASVVYPVIPLVTAAGLASIPWRVVRGAVMSLVVALAALQWVNRSFPDEDRPLGRRFRHYPQPPLVSQLFQGALVPDLKPRENTPHGWEARLLTRHITGSACPERRTVVLLNTDDYQDLRLVLTLVDPCLEVRSWPEIDGLEAADFLLSVEWLFDPREGRPDILELARRRCDDSNMPWSGRVRALLEAGTHEQLELDRAEQRCMRVVRRR